MGSPYLIATTGAVLFKAGRNVQTSGGTLLTSAAMMMRALSGAESYVNTASGYNWSDTYSSLDKDLKYVISDAVANIAAINIINYDMSGYTDRQEATTMMNVLWGLTQDDLDVLKDSDRRAFMGGA